MVIEPQFLAFALLAASMALDHGVLSLFLFYKPPVFTTALGGGGWVIALPKSSDTIEALGMPQRGYEFPSCSHYTGQRVLLSA
jgi:hypothetical protein